jgi:hypothetical protein
MEETPVRAIILITSKGTTHRRKPSCAKAVFSIYASFKMTIHKTKRLQMIKTINST